MKRPLRVLNLAKYDSKGGAARAARTSVAGQCAAGLDALLYAGRVLAPGPQVHGPRGWERPAMLARYVGERLAFRLLGVDPSDVRSLGRFGVSPALLEQRYRPDVVILHAVDGLVATTDLPRFSVPLVWRLHDMWPLGGSRHYADVATPIGGRILDRLDQMVWRVKASAYPRVRSLTLSSPSRWLADVAAASPLTRDLTCVVIPNGIDTSRFRPMPVDAARATLGLAGSGPIIGFGAAGGVDDPRKGFDLLLTALRRVDADLAAIGARLAVIGGGREAAFSGLATPVHHLGAITALSRLVAAYAALDLFVAPSRMENLSLMVLEALACGTPVAAFAIGGMPDMVRTGATGWLVTPYDVGELGGVLVAAAGRGDAAGDMRAAARRLAEREFSTDVEATATKTLVQRLTAQAAS